MNLLFIDYATIQLQNSYLNQVIEYANKNHNTVLISFKNVDFNTEEIKQIIKKNDVIVFCTNSINAKAELELISSLFYFRKPFLLILNSMPSVEICQQIQSFVQESSIPFMFDLQENLANVLNQLEDIENGINCKIHAKILFDEYNKKQESLLLNCLPLTHFFFNTTDTIRSQSQISSIGNYYCLNANANKFFSLDFCYSYKESELFILIETTAFFYELKYLCYQFELVKINKKIEKNILNPVIIKLEFNCINPKIELFFQQPINQNQWTVYDLLKISKLYHLNL